MFFDFPALQCVPDKYAAMVLHGACTMQQFMRQVDIISVAHFIKECIDLLDALSSWCDPLLFIVLPALGG